MTDDPLLVAETDESGAVVWVWYYSARKKYFRSARQMREADLQDAAIFGAGPKDVYDWIAEG